MKGIFTYFANLITKLMAGKNQNKVAILKTINLNYFVN